MREVEPPTGVIKRLAESLQDYRGPDGIAHSAEELLAVLVDKAEPVGNDRPPDYQPIWAPATPPYTPSGFAEAHPWLGDRKPIKNALLACTFVRRLGAMG